MSASGHSRRFDHLIATSALSRTTDISDRPDMSEECDFRTISEVPQSEPRASGRADVSFTGQSIGGCNGDTH
jgi:hypothetical protein